MLKCAGKLKPGGCIFLMETTLKSSEQDPLRINGTGRKGKKDRIKDGGERIQTNKINQEI
jgi:hypothetical protein